MSIANNARDMLAQAEHALQRIDNGTYGVCESCGNPIGKARLQAFPACHAVRVMQTARGASLNDAHPAAPTPTLRRRRLSVLFAVAIFVYALDQVTKTSRCATCPIVIRSR